MIVIVVVMSVLAAVSLLWAKIAYSEELRARAESGDLDAQCDLGLCYGEGRGVEIDQQLAIRWYQKAADRGHAPSLHNLGVHYNNGEGVARSCDTAFRLWSQAADQGYVSSINNIGFCYENGLGVQQDYARALSWYRKAAELDLPDAMFEVGRYHYEGLGVERNLGEAYYWLYTAFVLGDEESGQLAKEIERELGKTRTDEIKGDAWPRIERIFNENEARSDGPESPYGGGDGSDFAEAVIIRKASSSLGVAAEYDYIKRLAEQKGLSWKRGRQALAHEGGKSYDVLDVIWSDGSTQKLYFDISGFFGKSR